MLKEHYIYDHLVCANNFHFKQLCDIQFKDSKAKTPLNINGGGNTRYFSTNFTQHDRYYDFFNENIVADFLKTVDEHFVPDGGKKKSWYSETYSSKYFSSYVKSEIGHQIFRKITRC